jgi:hypothetical protein
MMSMRDLKREAEEDFRRRFGVVVPTERRPR